tara:strand:- start:159 stop:509 length:351 start_codon:yes stop_codon:yes gene_type:complete
MRILLMFFALSITSLSAQEKKIVTEEGINTFKVVYYNEAGNILQQGYVINKKLHGEWSSFYKDGIKAVSGHYEKGKKVGKWFFWNKESIREVDFVDNNVIKVVNWSSPTKIATVDD